MRKASTASWRFPLVEINSQQPPSPPPGESEQQLNLSQTIISRWMEQRRKKVTMRRLWNLIAHSVETTPPVFACCCSLSWDEKLHDSLARLLSWLDVLCNNQQRKKRLLFFFLLHSRSCLAAARGMEPPRSIAWIQCEQKSSGGDAMIANRVKLVFWSIYERERKSSKTTTIFSERSQWLLFSSNKSRELSPARGLTT